MATAAGRSRQMKQSGPGGGNGGGGGGAAARKIKIKPFKRPPSLPPDFYDRTSSVLLEATRAILRHEPLYAHGGDDKVAAASAAARDPPAVVAATGAVAPQAASCPPAPSRSPTSAMLNPDAHIHQHASGMKVTSSRRPIGREELYRSVEDLCVHRYAPRLYEAVVRAVDDGAFESMERLCDTAGAVRVVVNGGDGGPTQTQIAFSSLPSSDGAAPLLSAVRKVYADYSDYMFFVRSIFLYLDRSYVLHSGSATRSLWEVGIDSFRRQMTMQRSVSEGASSSSAAAASSSGPSGTDAMLVDGDPPSAVADPTSPSTRVGGGNVVSVSDAVVCGILHLVRRERDGEAIDRALLRGLLRMMAELDLYASEFLPAFLSSSASYYEVEGERVLNVDTGGDVPTFLRHVETRLQQCQEACVAYLDCYDSFSHPSSSSSSSATSSGGGNGSGSEKFHGTRKALLTVVENHLLKPHAEVVLQPKNCHALFGDPHRVVPDVKRMYVLLNRIGYSAQLKAAFYQFARHVGLEIVHEKGAGGAGSSVDGDGGAGPVPRFLVSSTVITTGSSSASSERDVVPKLLRLRRHLTDVHVRAFDSDEQFHGAIRDAFEHVLNSRGSKPSELLARHVDALLKSTRKDKTADGGDAEGALDEVMVLFRHLHSKDVFEAFYQKDLARRLLHGKSSSVDMERSFLSKLKAECGSGYTSKMEGMFKDIELSRDIMAQYSEYVRDKVCSASAGLNGGTSRVDMDVQILTTGYWPQYPQHKSIKLPDELQVHIQRFENYYDNKYQGRRIHWQYSLCNCNLKANFAEKRMELLVNLYQALVLLCFNDNDGLTLPQVRDRTGIDDRNELERVLQSLSMGKPGTRVLIKVDAPPPGGGVNPKPKKSVADTDVFRYNAKFTNKLNRIKIPQIQARETVHSEQSKIHEAVARDRQYLIDAAIVRIMKARKTIQHRDLIGEVMNQVKNVSRPVSSEIKKRIEGLMEREYLERDEADKTVYNYLA